MFIYMGLLFITIICYGVCLIINDINKRNKSFLILVSIPLIYIMGMRDKYIGTDTIQYYNAFININNINVGWLDYKDTRYELGYYILNKFVGLFSLEPQVFLIIASIIIVGFIFLFIYHNSVNPFISVLLFQTLFYYCNSFNLLRQYIAIAIVINCIYYIKEKKLLKACIIVILASLFHTSAICLLPIVILLCKVKVNSGNIYKYLVWITLVSLSIPLLIQIIISIFPRYEFYLTYSSIYNGGKIMPYVYICLVIAGLILSKRIKNNDNVRMNNFYILNIFVYITSILGIVSNLYFESASRIIPYFSLSLIVLIPAFMSFFKRKIDQLIMQGCVLFFTIIYYVLLLNNGVAGVNPYYFFNN